MAELERRKSDLVKILGFTARPAGHERYLDLFLHFNDGVVKSYQLALVRKVFPTELADFLLEYFTAALPDGTVIDLSHITPTGAIKTEIVDAPDATTQIVGNLETSSTNMWPMTFAFVLGPNTGQSPAVPSGPQRFPVVPSDGPISFRQQSFLSWSALVFFSLNLSLVTFLLQSALLCRISPLRRLSKIENKFTCLVFFIDFF